MQPATVKLTQTRKPLSLLQENEVKSSISPEDMTVKQLKNLLARKGVSKGQLKKLKRQSDLLQCALEVLSETSKRVDKALAKQSTVALKTDTTTVVANRFSRLSTQLLLHMTQFIDTNSLISLARGSRDLRVRLTLAVCSDASSAALAKLRHCALHQIPIKHVAESIATRASGLQSVTVHIRSASSFKRLAPLGKAAQLRELKLILPSMYQHRLKFNLPTLHMPHIRSLAVQGPAEGYFRIDFGAGCLAGFTGLERMSLEGVNIVHQPFIAGLHNHCPELRFLSFVDVQMVGRSDDAQEATISFAVLPLTTLVLPGDANVKGIPKTLTSLTCAPTSSNLSDAAYICRKLQSLTLWEYTSNCQDTALEYLEHMHHLERLCLRGVLINDRSDILSELKQRLVDDAKLLPALRTLTVEGWLTGKVTEAKFAAQIPSRPQLRVEFHRSTTLMPHGYSCPCCETPDSGRYFDRSPVRRVKPPHLAGNHEHKQAALDLVRALDFDVNVSIERSELETDISF